MNPDSTFDYIVVGAGSAGCVVAARLSENPAARVLLLEGGGSNDHPDVHDPLKWPTLFSGPLAWGYTTAPMRHCLGRIDHVPRARMLGGCHSHNASVWVRGHRADYDHWASLGNAGWSWADVLPVFQKIENWQGPADSLRGTSGPMYVAPPDSPNAVAAAFVQAGPAIGLPTVADNNGPSREGTSFFNMTIKDGKRFTVVDAYLRPAMARKNLTIVTNAITHRLVMQGASLRLVGMAQS